MHRVFKKKSIEAVHEVNERSELRKTLNSLDILLLGVGAVLGTGVFVMTGVTAAKFSGPAVTLSYLLAGFAAIFMALAYTEIAAMIPGSGSIYTYAYVSFGEIIAWLIGWTILLEYTLSAVTVAAGWSGYIYGILAATGMDVPQEFFTTPAQGGLINLPAVIISLFISFLLLLGTKESARFNNILVAVKLVAIFIFVWISVPHFEVTNWTNNFMPFGFSGVTTGAAIIFFGYTGFDLLSTTTEECKNPKRDIIFGLIGSLIVCMIIYTVVSGLLTGIVPYGELDNNEPLAYAMRKNGSNIGSAIVATGAVAGMTTVLLVQLFAQSRLIFFLSRDGMLPKVFGKIHPKFRTPYITHILIGTIVAALAGFTPIELAGNLASTAMLTEYMAVAIMVLYLRYKMPLVARPFKCPLIFVIAPVAILLCGFLIHSLISEATIIFLIWGIIGVVVYFIYGYRNSKLSK